MPVFEVTYTADDGTEWVAVAEFDPPDLACGLRHGKMELLNATRNGDPQWYELPDGVYNALVERAWQQVSSPD